MPLQLSGYLPGKDHNGLDEFAGELVERFEAAYSDSDHNPVQVVVVGVLTAQSVKHHRDPEDKPPSVEVRFSAIEGAQGKQADQLRWVIAALQQRRQGQPMLDGFDQVVKALIEGTDELPPPPPDVVDQRGGSATSSED